jgi:hypothetical protein
MTDTSVFRSAVRLVAGVDDNKAFSSIEEVPHVLLEEVVLHEMKDDVERERGLRTQMVEWELK